MSSTKSRAPRLGKGLSALMAQPVAIAPTPASAEPAAGSPEATASENTPTPPPAPGGAVPKSASKTPSSSVAPAPGASAPKTPPAAAPAGPATAARKPSPTLAGRDSASATSTSPAPAGAKPVARPEPSAGEGGQALPPNHDGNAALSASPATAAAAASDLVYLPIDAIRPNPHQPRQKFDAGALARLAESIRADGVMQPVMVRRIPGAAGGSGVQYELVAGERRWRAAQQAGLSKIPALVRTLTDRQLAELSLVENLQREDLNPIERAEAFRRLMEQFHLSHDQIAARVGVERSTISNSLRLLTLDKIVQDLVREGLVSAGHARAIAALTDPSQQIALAKRTVTQGLSVRVVESAVRVLQGRASGDDDDGQEPATPSARSAHLADLERQIARQLGTKARVQQGRKKGTGKLILDFYSVEQFENLLTRLGVQVE